MKLKIFAAVGWLLAVLFFSALWFIPNINDIRAAIGNGGSAMIFTQDGSEKPIVCQ